MSRWFAAVAVLAALAACGRGPDAALSLEATAMAQTNPPSVALRVVPPATLRDRALSDDAFVVREDGDVRPVKVDPLGPDTVEVSLVVDLASPKGAATQVGDLRRAAAAFLLGLPAGVRLAVVDAGAPPTRASMTRDIGAAIGAIGAMQPPAPGDLEAAIAAAVAGFAPAKGFNRNLVILTTGVRELDERLVERLTHTVRDNHVVAHVLGVRTLNTSVQLSHLARATGGSVTLGGNAAELSFATNDAVANLTSGYRVEFVPTGAGATELEVEVRHADVVATTVISLDLPGQPGAADREAQPGSAADLVGPATVAAGATLVVTGALLARSIVTHRRRSTPMVGTR